MKSNSIDKKKCIMHIRSGDDFILNTFHPIYVYPPSAYYKKIITKYIIPRISFRYKEF